MLWRNIKTVNLFAAILEWLGGVVGALSGKQLTSNSGVGPRDRLMEMRYAGHSVYKQDHGS